jgi:hypothetical protein
MAGSCGFGYIVVRYGFWHEAIAVIVLGAAAVWILGGAALLGRARHVSASRLAGRAADSAAMRAAAERAAHNAEQKGTEL